MFRARDSCRADVRRGRSPKCLFIKATATGKTINGLNDEINKPSEAGHSGARLQLRWPGCHHWAEPQTCLQARSLPDPAALPAPQTPARPSATPHACPQSLAQAVPLLPASGHCFVPSWPPKVQVNARLGVCFNFSSEGPNLTLQAAQGEPGGPWKPGKAGVPPPLLPGLSVQFLVSGKLCLPWMTDG